VTLEYPRIVAGEGSLPREQPKQQHPKRKHVDFEAVTLALINFGCNVPGTPAEVPGGLVVANDPGQTEINNFQRPEIPLGIASKQYILQFQVSMDHPTAVHELDACQYGAAYINGHPFGKDFASGSPVIELLAEDFGDKVKIAPAHKVLVQIQYAGHVGGTLLETDQCSNLLAVPLQIIVRSNHAPVPRIEGVGSGPFDRHIAPFGGKDIAVLVAIVVAVVDIIVVAAAAVIAFDLVGEFVPTNVDGTEGSASELWK
jgi:hypothetical protein